MRKMIEIKSEYIITKDASALIPAKSIEYNTIVLTSREKLYIKMTPLEIIKNSCLHDLASYEGRREAVKHMMDYQKKIPIPINTSQEIYAFPTMSPSNDECIWLFFHQIKKVVDNRKHGSKEEEYASTIHFADNSQLSIDVSHFSLQQQLQRTAMCKNIIES